MLQFTIDWLLFNIIGIDSQARYGQSLNFFLYDTIKIIILVYLMIAFVGFIRSYISQEKIKKWLSSGFGNLYASLFGALTPFCSCSSIPFFLGFIRSGIPLGVTYSFLVTSPLVNEYLVILMLTFFGWKITLAYVLFGILIGVVSGLILGKMNLEKYLIRDITKGTPRSRIYKSIKERIKFALIEANGLVKKLWLWIVLGVGFGALVHGYVPEDAINRIIGVGGIFTVPISVLLGVPIYANCVAIVPIAVVLFEKGLPLGTALAFMMATSALSFPEAVILKSAMKTKLIVIFFSIVTLGIIIIGYLFNWLQPLLI